MLTAGTTTTGAVDPLERPEAGWVHVDAAWAGPLRLSARWRHLLDGIDQADSVAISAHKWLHQPKESAIVLFQDTAAAHGTLTYGGAYLAAPNVGLLGSHGFAALSLAATILAYGLEGLGAWVDHGMALAARLSDLIAAEDDLEQLGAGPGSGVVVWRHRRVPPPQTLALLQGARVSMASIEGEPWLRSVAANPLADPERVVRAVLAAGADRPESAR